jgi:alginate O-acetyltransferase complex protein AlgI
MPPTASLLRKLPRILSTFYLLMVGFVLFRAGTLGGVGRVLRDMHWPSAPSKWSYGAVVTLLLVVAALVGCHAAD